MQRQHIIPTVADVVALTCVNSFWPHSRYGLNCSSLNRMEADRVGLTILVVYYSIEIENDAQNRRAFVSNIRLPIIIGHEICGDCNETE